MLDGWLVLIRGFGACNRHKSLWVWVLLPLVLNLLLFAGLFYLGIHYLSPWAFGFLQSWIGDIAPFFRYLLMGILVYVFYLFVIYFFNTIGLMLGGFFYTVLAHKMFVAVQKKETGIKLSQSGPRFKQVMVYELKKFGILTLGGLLLTLLTWLLPYLSWIFLILLICLLSYEYYDYAFEGVQLPYPQRWSWIRGNFWPFFSSGLVIYLMLSIPLLGFMLCPLCVAGSTDIVIQSRMIAKPSPG
jgi:CysZ protein